MTSISVAYTAYGSKGLTEAGKQERMKRLVYATGGVALTVMGLALAVIAVFGFNGVIPGLPPLGPDRIFNLAFGTELGVILSVAPIAALILPGVFLTGAQILRLDKELSAEDRAVFLEPPAVKDFEPHKVL